MVKKYFATSQLVVKPEQKYLLLTRLLSCRYGLQIALNACELGFSHLAFNVRAELITFQASELQSQGGLGKDAELSLTYMDKNPVSLLKIVHFREIS